MVPKGVDPFSDETGPDQADSEPPDPRRVILNAWSRGIFGGTLSRGMVVDLGLIGLTVLGAFVVAAVHH
jgi:hypothetical protein